VSCSAKVVETMTTDIDIVASYVIQARPQQNNSIDHLNYKGQKFKGSTHVDETERQLASSDSEDDIRHPSC
jgi:hypothetical protein